MRSFVPKTGGLLLALWLLVQLANVSSTQYKPYEMILEYPDGGLKNCSAAALAGGEAVASKAYEKLIGSSNVDQFSVINDVCAAEDYAIDNEANEDGGADDSNSGSDKGSHRGLVEIAPSSQIRHRELRRRRGFNCRRVCRCRICFSRIETGCYCHFRERELFSIFTGLFTSPATFNTDPCDGSVQNDLNQWAAAYLTEYRRIVEESTDFIKSIGLMDADLALHICDQQYLLKKGETETEPPSLSSYAV